MKTCPVCRRTYEDESFSFCLEDGTLLSVSNESQATIVIPKKFDDLPPTAFLPNQISPTQKSDSEQLDVIEKLQNYLVDERQIFSTLGKFRYNNEFIWTNGHFFEIAATIPTDLLSSFPLKESTSPVELIKSLQSQLKTSYSFIQSIAVSKKETIIDLISENHTIHVNKLYFQYLHFRYPQAAIMAGTTPYNPALFVVNDKLRAGIMGVRT